ncbi:MAG: hypothetical protein R2941_15730, partial [Desulfobacterales bacterium]
PADQRRICFQHGQRKKGEGKTVKSKIFYNIDSLASLSFNPKRRSGCNLKFHPESANPYPEENCSVLIFSLFL